jgi:Spy/CpxP family protein refolding chaperone
MKRVLLTLIIIVLTAGYTLAEDAQNTNIQQKPAQKISKPVNTYSGGRYSRQLNVMITSALSMDITADQKAGVTNLREKYVIPISDAETEIRQSQMDIRKMLEDPSFDPAKVKKEMDKMNDETKKVTDDYVDGLTSLRDTIGKENYEKLNNSVSKYRNDLVQMRKHGVRHSPQSYNMRQNKPGQPPQPETQAQGSGN